MRTRGTHISAVLKLSRENLVRPCPKDAMGNINLNTNAFESLEAELNRTPFISQSAAASVTGSL